MGQKIHPTGFRLSVNRNWASKWYANSKDFPAMLKEDLEVRQFLRKKLTNMAVSRVVIERPAKNAKITLHSARPGLIIGKNGGENVNALRNELQKLMGVSQLHLNVEEVRKPELEAQLIADGIAAQLEKRVMFRRAMKRAMSNAMRLGAQGIKIASSGRLNGIEIARTEWYREGRVPLHTLRADIDYATAEALTTYGIIGIKVWVYKGDLDLNQLRRELPKQVRQDNKQGRDNREGRENDPQRRKPQKRGGVRKSSGAKNNATTS